PAAEEAGPQQDEAKEAEAAVRTALGNNAEKGKRPQSGSSCLFPFFALPSRCSWFEGRIMATASIYAKSVLSSLGQSRLVTIFKIKELRQKIIITLLFLAIYRVGFHIPLPMIDQQQMAQA